MIDAGVYKARAATWGLGETKGGKEQVAVEFVLLDAEGAEGPHITYYGSFSDAAFDITIKALRTCGWQGDDLSELMGPGAGLDANEVTLIIEHEEYEGKTSAKVRWVNPAGGLQMKAPLSPDRAKAFAAAMKGRVVALRAGERSAARATQQPKSRTGGVLSPEPPPHGESDLPF